MLDDRPYMRRESQQSSWSPVLVLVIVNVAVFAAQLVLDLVSPTLAHNARVILALSPDGLQRGWIWQILTFQFLHAGLFHLLINCAMLWIFGRTVVAQAGTKNFLRIYFFSGILGGLLQVMLSWLFPFYFGMGAVVGASAGVFGLIAAFAALNWEQPITSYFALVIPVTMAAKYLILVESVFAVFGLLSRGSGIAHGAHLGGILTGLAYVRWIILSEKSFANWAPFRRVPRQRELVTAHAPRRTAWQRPEKPAEEELAPSEFISREVDPILDKISAHGIQSLTDDERKILEAARKKIARR